MVLLQIYESYWIMKNLRLHGMSKVRLFFLSHCIGHFRRAIARCVHLDCNFLLIQSAHCADYNKGSYAKNRPIGLDFESFILFLFRNLKC